MFATAMNTTEHKLRERVKELNCLYELSKVAWEADSDLEVIFNEILRIVPNAMQHRQLAEVVIIVGTKRYETRGYTNSLKGIESRLVYGKKKYGTIRVGYRQNRGVSPTFLPEEKRLLQTVARELSLVINRVSVEDDKRKLQLQLQHVERLAFVGELSAGIAHELNEPLGRVLGFAQLIRKAGNLNHQQEEDIERIIKASLYSREIIKKLMIFSRQMPQQLAVVSLNAVVENILYFIDVRFQSSGIEIVKQLDNSLPEIRADEVQLGQVLVNLITNSVYAMPNGGVITVATRKRENGVALIVKDNGIGMPADIKRKIFEPFFTTKPPGQGTGLGLSVVQGIVESHNGTISLQSAPGKGTRFEIVLPINKEKKKRR